MRKTKWMTWALCGAVAAIALGGCGQRADDATGDPTAPAAGGDAGSASGGPDGATDAGSGVAAPAAGGEGAADPAASTAPMPAGDPADLGAVLAAMPETQRVAAAVLRPLCGKSTTCLTELDAVEAYARDDCPRDSTCPEVVAGFVQAPEGAAGTELTETFPTVAQIRDVLWKATYDEAASEGGRVAPTEEAPDAGAAETAAPAATPTASP